LDAEAAEVSNTSGSFDKPKLAEVCPTACSLGIHELAAVAFTSADDTVGPRRFRRIRHAGLLTQRKRTQYLAICRELLKDRMPKEPEPERDTKQSDKQSENATKVESDPVLDTPSCQADKHGRQEEQPHDQPTPPRRCPRCLGTEFEFIECYRPDRDPQRAQHRFRVRPP
jgi:hypothetical protein